MIILKDYDPNMYIAGCDEAYLKCVETFILPEDVQTEQKIERSLTTYLTDHNMNADDCVQAT